MNLASQFNIKCIRTYVTHTKVLNISIYVVYYFVDSQKSLYDIGMLSMSKKDYRQAIGWFDAAKKQKTPPLGNPAKIHSATSDAYLKVTL